MKDWKKKLASSLRSMELGFSGSQARWIEVFIETLLAKQKKEIIKELKKMNVDEVIVSKRTSKTDNVARWKEIGKSEEAKYGWNEAIGQIIKTIKEI